MFYSVLVEADRNICVFASSHTSCHSEGLLTQCAVNSDTVWDDEDPRAVPRAPALTQPGARTVGIITAQHYGSQ